MLLLSSRSRSSKFPSALALSLTLLLATSAIRAGASYDIQTINDSMASQASGTLPRGVSGSTVVGYYNDSNNVTHGFIFDGTNSTTLDDPLAGTGQDEGTSATAIDGANIAGYFYDSQQNNYGFIYNGSAFANFTVKGAPQSTYINGISGKNIVGSYFNPTTDVYHGYFYNGTTSAVTNLDDPNADVIGDTYPQGVQGKLVVGYYNTSAKNSFSSHGFLYNGTAFTTLDDPDAGPHGTCAEGIFNGTIVGFYYDSDSDAHGFLYNGTAFTTFDVTNANQTFVYGINNGSLVGDYYDSDNDVHGFLATPSITTVPAAIASSPVNTSVSANTNATFSITYTGVPVPDIQWQISTNGGTQWTNVTASIAGGTFSGFTTATLTAVAVATGQSGAQFRAMITNSGGSDTSEPATLTVTAAVGIVINSLGTNLDASQQFSGITYVFAKQSVILQSSVTGPGVLTYQWQLKGKSVSKATTANFTITSFAAANAGNYTLRIHSSLLSSNTTSSIIPLAVGILPSFPKAPANVTVVSGANATFTAIPAGSPTPTVQWQVSSNGGLNWSDLFDNATYAGIDTTTLTVTANSSLTTFQYRAEADNLFNGVESKAATLTVTPPPLPLTLQGKYKIQSVNADIVGLFSSNISPLPTSAKNFSATLGPKGVAGVSATVIDSLVASIGKGSAVKLTTTSPSTTTTYNAKISGTIAFVLGSVDYTITPDSTSTVSAILNNSGVLLVTANINGPASVAGASIGSVSVVVTITLTQ